MVRSTTWRIRLMLLLASFAASLSSLLGGFLWGVIIPLPVWPLSAIHPEGSSPSSSPECAWGGHVVHGPQIRVGGPHQTPARQDHGGHETRSFGWVRVGRCSKT